MGFTEQVARKVLAECVWDVNKAIDRLLMGDFVDDTPAVDVKAAPGVSDVKDATVAAAPEAWPSMPSAAASGASKAPALAAAVVRSSDAEEDAKSTSAGSQLGSQDVTGASSLSSCEEDSAAADCASSAQGSEACEAAVAAVEGHADIASPANVATVASPARAAEPVSPEPRKRIERAKMPHAPEGQVEAGQMAVAEGDFVRIWIDQETEHGWIYSEALAPGGAVGWIPRFVLQETLPHQRWMCTLQACASSNPNQMHVKERDVLLVNIESRTDAGWAYAEAAPGAVQEGGGPGEGWVPVFCLDWHQE